MKLSKKIIIPFILITAIIITLFSFKLKSSIPKSETATKTENITPIIESSTPEKISTPQPKEIIYKSDADIKKAFGKIERVTLWTGRIYTGAVISDSVTYKIVTVEGTKNFPIKEIKLRELIE